MKPRLPRLLLLSAESPHSSSPGGIVLQRMLSEYPSNRLLVVTNHLPPAGAERLACSYECLPLAVDRLNRTRLSPWRARLRAWGGPDWIKLERVDAAVGAFAPEVVVTVMQDSWFYDLAARYAFTRDLPLVVLIHDLQSGFEPVPRWLQARQHQRDKQVLRQASARLCISTPMTKFFAESFGLAAEVLPPPRSAQPIQQAPANAAHLRIPGQLTLGYAGGLHYGYGKQLLAMLPALRATNTKVELFCPTPGGSVAPLAEATDVFHFNGHAPTPQAAWQTLLARCDAILQPYLNPPGPHELQYRTHFPSKLGDALSLGLPLLVTGPEYASGLAWCVEHDRCALTVTDPGEAALVAALRELKENHALRQDLATRAVAAAAHLDATLIREQFIQHVQAATQTNRRPHASNQ